MDATIQLDEKKAGDKREALQLHTGESCSKVVGKLMATKTDEGALGEEAIRETGHSLVDIQGDRAISMTFEVRFRQA